MNEITTQEETTAEAGRIDPVVMPVNEIDIAERFRRGFVIHTDKEFVDPNKSVPNGNFPVAVLSLSGNAVGVAVFDNIAGVFFVEGGSDSKNIVGKDRIKGWSRIKKIELLRNS